MYSRKRLKLFMIAAVCAACVSGIASTTVNADENNTENVTNVLEKTDIFENQNQIDEAFKSELDNKYPLDNALIVVNPYGTSPLSAVALFSTDETTGGTITVKGKSPENDIVGNIESAKDHIVPIYGLYNGDTTTVEISLEDGEKSSFEVTTEKTEMDYGDVKMEIFDEANYDYSNLSFLCSTMGSVYAVDGAGDIRFYTDMGGSLGVHFLANGHLMMPAPYVLKTSYYKEGLLEVDLNGKIYREYAIPGGQHHDFRELSNGNLLVASDSPDLSSVEDYVVEIDRESGEVVWELDMKDLLDIEDGASASMESDGSDEEDWFHNNGLWYDEENDLVLLSARHKDAIVAVHKTDKKIAWILGDPTGWDKTDKSLFFTPTGDDFEWFYAQHCVSMLDNGDIMLFDNGTAKVKRTDNENRVTGDQVYSRAVIYHINTDDMTVSQVYEYGKERGADWYADWISGVDSLDGTKDHLFITAGSHLYSAEENRSDFYPSDMFRQGLTKMTHIDQVDEGNLTAELTLSGDSYSVLTFRAFRMPLYTENTDFDITAKPEVLGSLGETPYETQEIDLSSAEALPEGWTIKLDDLKVSVEGNYQTESKADEPADGTLVFSNGTETRGYALTQTSTEGDNGVNVKVSGWVSTDSLDGEEWEIYIQADGKLYNTKYKLAL